MARMRLFSVTTSTKSHKPRGLSRAVEAGGRITKRTSSLAFNSVFGMWQAPYSSKPLALAMGCLTAGISLNNLPHSISPYQPNPLSLRRTDPIQDALLGASRKGRLATKIPPKNLQWPSRRGSTLDDCFPPDHNPGRSPVFRAVGVGWFAVNCFSAMSYGGRLAISVYRAQVTEIK